MDTSEKLVFRTIALLSFVIIVSTLIIFILTPSPISPTRHFFGYIRRVYLQDKTIYLDFDPAQWFEDTATTFAASAACVQDGRCPHCPLPLTKPCIFDGHYTRNPDPKTTPFSLASFTKIGTLLLDPSWNPQIASSSSPYRTINPQELLDIYQHPDSPDSWLTSAPFDITVINPWIIVANQHYIP